MDTSSGFTIVELFSRADIIVKIVMIGLGLTSVWSWAIMIEKAMQIGKLEKSARNVEQMLSDGKGNDNILEASRAGNATARIIAIGMNEAALARRGGALSDAAASAVVERMERAMGAQTQREIAKAEKGIGVLATIGSSATFVGLFGTVWGIMNSFRAIAASHDTNLAVVAPGIAEALFATALGLVAAIPAVVFYNWLIAALDRYSVRIEALCDDVIVRTSRRLSENA